ncbi:MAG: IS256 family transposase [Acidimicrobiales bacterium mtb01]|nr:IS256 family transposase [Actinomycetota bacterium]TEX47993.1 MAG: IS256 family transposase [Acidimicrobiales bacterium mtb01]
MSMSENDSRLPAVPDQPVLSEIARLLVERARGEGVALTGEGGLLPALVANVLQAGLNIEFDDHVGYAPHAVEGRGSGNSRNGSYPKTVITEVGPVEVQMPRDRNGSFDPVTVPKHVRRLEGLSEQVISLFAKGMTTGDIQTHLFEIYGTEISRETISKITDAVVGEMNLWQNRPLDRMYPVVLIDAIVIKVRDAQVANRPVYVAIGVNMDGERDVLGMWLGPTGGEGAKQWMTMLTDLRNRGIADVWIVCCDGLKGLPDAIRTTWKDATVQTCVVHLVRNSLRYASKADWGKITKGLRAIYTAPTVEAATLEFDAFADTWRSKYPAMIVSWENSWNEFVPFLEFPVELRKIVYTTNAIESLNARFRKAVRHRGHFPNEQAAMKVLYLVATTRRPNRENLVGRIAGWKHILNTLTVHYGDRIEAATK